MSELNANRKSMERIAWAIEFSQQDLRSFRAGDWLNLREELGEFVKATDEDLTSKKSLLATPKKAICEVQQELLECVKKLAVGDHAEIRQSGYSILLHDVQLTVSSDGKSPFVGVVVSQDIVSRVLATFALNLSVSRVTGEQIRACPTCGKMFLLRRKPRADREFHCSTRCARLSAIRRMRSAARAKRAEARSRRRASQSKSKG